MWGYTLAAESSNFDQGQRLFLMWKGAADDLILPESTNEVEKKLQKVRKQKMFQNISVIIPGYGDISSKK